MTRKLSAPLASLVIAAYPVLFLFEKNPLEARLSDFFKALAGALIVGGVLLVVLSELYRNWRKGALGASFLGLSCLLYGPMVAWIDPDLYQPGLGLSRLAVTPREMVALPLFCLVVVLVLWLIRRMSDSNLQVASLLLFTFAGVLLLFPLFGIFIRVARTQVAASPFQNDLAAYEPVSVPRRLPDIYYIILDAYGREDVLREEYGMGDDSLASFLRGKGFFVAEKAFSNYPITVLSLSSSLNGAYINDIPNPFDRKSTDNGPLIRSIHDAGVVALLKKFGYRIVTISSGYHPTELDNPDDTFETGRINNFGAAALGYVQFPGLRSLISWRVHTAYREMLLSNLRQLSDVQEVEGPKFVFFHLIAPHPPFVFSAHGDLVPPQKVFSWGDGDHYGTREEYRAKYAAQARYISSQMKSAIQDLLTHSAYQPVIIIQGDHGPGSETFFRSPLKSNFHERLAILNAYYFPGKDYSKLYDSISPVNSFRAALNSVLGQDLKLKEDRSYFTGLKYPFDLTDVTDKR